jgi:type I restriction enzyme, S subunit
MREFVLADLLELTKDGEWGKGDPSPDLEPMLVIRGTDFANVRYSNITSVPMRYIPRAIAERKALQPGDILIETAGGTKDQPTGRTVFLKGDLFPLSEIRFTCASFSRFLRVKKELVRPDYLFWFLQNLYRTGRMYPFHVQHTGVARFQYTQFARSQIVQVPDISEQDGIATLLNSIDDKIDLNRRMNETLEAMARAIFKDWFIDFGPTRAKMVGRAAYLAPEIWALFPDRLDVEGKPEGWTKSTVKAEFKLTMGQSPPGDTYNDAGNGLPFFQGRTDFGARYPKRRIYCTAPTRFAEVDDTLVSVRAPVGDLNMAWERCCVGRGVAAVRHSSGARGYTYHALNSLQPDLAAFEHTGTVFGAINKDQFEKLKIIAPGSDLVEVFEQAVSSLDDRVRANLAEISSLISVRDILLPKLLSGEIPLRDVGKALEAVA